MELEREASEVTWSVVNRKRGEKEERSRNGKLEISNLEFRNNLQPGQNRSRSHHRESRVVLQRDYDNIG